MLAGLFGCSRAGSACGPVAGSGLGALRCGPLAWYAAAFCVRGQAWVLCAVGRSCAAQTAFCTTVVYASLSCDH